MLTEFSWPKQAMKAVWQTIITKTQRSGAGKYHN